MNHVELAALAGVAAPAGPDSPGAEFLEDVRRGVAGDLAEIGSGLHVGCLQLAAEDAEPWTDEEAWAAFLDLDLWNEGLGTREALRAVGVRLGAAMVAELARTSPPRARHLRR